MSILKSFLLTLFLKLRLIENNYNHDLNKKKKIFEARGTQPPTRTRMLK